MAWSHGLRHTEGMDEQQPPGGISVEEWQATPASVRQMVLALMADHRAIAERSGRVERASESKLAEFLQGAVE